MSILGRERGPEGGLVRSGAALPWMNLARWLLRFAIGLTRAIDVALTNNLVKGFARARKPFRRAAEIIRSLHDQEIQAVLASSAKQMALRTGPQSRWRTLTSRPPALPQILG